MIYLTSEQEQRFWSKVDIQGPDDRAAISAIKRNKVWRHIEV